MDKAAKALANSEIVSVSKRITTLEMKELNERQRAEHAQKMYEHMRNSLKQVEERNFELEAKLAEVCLFHRKFKSIAEVFYRGNVKFWGGCMRRWQSRTWKRRGLSANYETSWLTASTKTSVTLTGAASLSWRKAKPSSG